MLLRDALTPEPDYPFVRRVALVAGVTTAAILAGTIVMLLCAERRSPDILATIDIPNDIPASIAIATAHDPANRELALEELRSYAFEAFPAWATDHPTTECPSRLLELNRYNPRLHAVDPWGTPYQFICGQQYIAGGIGVRSAGPDRVFDTADDLKTHR